MKSFIYLFLIYLISLPTHATEFPNCGLNKNKQPIVSSSGYTYMKVDGKLKRMPAIEKKDTK